MYFLIFYKNGCFETNFVVYNIEERDAVVFYSVTVSSSKTIRIFLDQLKNFDENKYRYRHISSLNKNQLAKADRAS
jgi:hypothetical protein